MVRIEDFAALVPPDLLDKPGRVFYSGRQAFESRNDLYVLGLNSSGDPGLVSDTVQSNIDLVLRGGLYSWSRYLEGSNPFHIRMQHLFDRIDKDPKTVPASNLIFARSQSAERLGKAEIYRIAKDCWRFHRAIIDELETKVVVCLGRDVGKVVRKFLNSHHSSINSFTEDNDRGWASYTYDNSDGIFIVQLTHPSRADWTSCRSDPTGLVAAALESAGANPS